MPSLSTLLLALATVSLALAHPVHEHAQARRDIRIIGQTSSSLVRRQDAPELQALVDGNRSFRDADPALLKKLADDGQEPPFLYLGCSDSRVNDGTIFNAKPGTFFSERNIANQFHSTDGNTESVLAYGVSVLGVKHIVVMGHYGCGGVAAAIASRPIGKVDAANGAVQNWIEPIRELFASSSRPEIVELRERIKGRTDVEEPENNEPGFRALVEENVKASVGRIAQDSIITNHYSLLASNSSETANERRAEGGPAANVFIHGWVYDIENGEIKDLGISVGPPGQPIPAIPFAKVAGVAASAAQTDHTVQVRCEEMCKSKRSFLPANH
ncbi:carbonic anhydrase [Coprinopsis marcescibilis]|uniref:Carbonic anhydrase n=1 Tax=Coprinopsis marcescibilis TaxID=230819 RepID=A0A5C3L0P3_COPMA|nr:carbonic anhydrase [Coprinopsis marcescibilis]